MKESTDRQIRNRLMNSDMYNVITVNHSGFKPFVGNKQNMWYIGYLGKTLDNAFDLSHKNISELRPNEELYDLHLVRRDGMLINVASAMAKAMFARMPEARTIYNITYSNRMRDDWHEPDEQGITGRITNHGILEIRKEGKGVIFRISVHKL